MPSTRRDDAVKRLKKLSRWDYILELNQNEIIGKLKGINEKFDGLCRGLSSAIASELVEGKLAVEALDNNIFMALTSKSIDIQREYEQIRNKIDEEYNPNIFLKLYNKVLNKSQSSEEREELSATRSNEALVNRYPNLDITENMWKQSSYNGFKGIMGPLLELKSGEALVLGFNLGDFAGREEYTSAHALLFYKNQNSMYFIDSNLGVFAGRKNYTIEEQLKELLDADFSSSMKSSNSGNLYDIYALNNVANYDMPTSYHLFKPKIDDANDIEHIHSATDNNPLANYPSSSDPNRIVETNVTITVTNNETSTITAQPFADNVDNLF